LRSTLLSTGQILGSLLSVDDGQPELTEQNFSLVHRYAERCRDMISELRTTSSAVAQDLEGKKVVANKYAAAAKKLKQQLEQSKKDFGDVDAELRRSQEKVVQLTAQISALERQHSETEGEWRRAEPTVGVVDETKQHSPVEGGEVDSVAENCKKLEAEVALRTKEIEELKGEVLNRNETEQRLNGTVEELSQSLKEKDEQLNVQWAEMEENRTKLREAELLLEKKEAEMGRLTSDVDSSVSEVMELRQILRTKDEELSAVAVERVECLRKLRELELELERKSAQLGELNCEADRSMSELMEMQKARDDLLSGFSAERDEHSTKLRETELLLEQKDSELGKLTSELMELRHLLTAKDEMLDLVSAEAQVNMSRLVEIEQLLKQKNDELNKMIFEAEIDRTQCSNLEQALLTKTAEIETLSTANNDLQNSLISREQETAGLVSCHDAMMQEVTAKLSHVQDELDTKSSEVEQLMADNAQLLQRKEDEYNSSVVALTQQIALLQDEQVERREELNRKSVELADLSAMHEAHVHLSQDQLSALKTELSEKSAAEEELCRQSSEMEATICSLREELNSECRTSEKLRSECEVISAAVCDRDEQLKRLSDQLCISEDKVKRGQVFVAGLEQQLNDSSVTMQSLESDRAELASYRQQLAEALTSLGQKDQELEVLSRNNLELTAQLEMTRYSLDEAAEDVQPAKADSAQSDNRAVGTEESELTELNVRLSVELTTLRNRLANLEVENCALRNASGKPGKFFAKKGATGGDVVDRGFVERSAEVSVCQLSERSPSAAGFVTELVQGNPATSENPAGQFMTIESLKEAFEVEKEKNLAQIEALAATKQKMLAKMKQLKASNDSLISQVDELQQELASKGTELSHIPQLESEISNLSGRLTVLEDEKRSWLSAEDSLKVTVSSLREEVAGAEKRCEEGLRRCAATEADKSRLEEQLESARNELCCRQVDFESQITTLRSEKKSLENCLELTKAELSGRDEVSKQKVADLQMLHDALVSDTESYQQLLEQVTSDKSRLEEVVRTQSETVNELHAEIETLRTELVEAERQKEAVEEERNSEPHLDREENFRIAEHELDLARKENSSLLERVEGLNWRVQELSEMEQELTQLQAEMFEVQSENGMLKKRLSFVEKEAAEKSTTEEDCGRMVEVLEGEKQRLELRLEVLESQVSSLHAELDAKSFGVEKKDVQVQCFEAEGQPESEQERSMRQSSPAEAETKLNRSETRPSVDPKLEETCVPVPKETHDQRLISEADKTSNLLIQLEELQQHYLILKSENDCLKSQVKGMKSDNELLHQKVVACQTGSPRPRSTTTLVQHRLHEPDQQRAVQANQLQVMSSFLLSLIIRVALR